jgi:hypothetical protein
MLADDRTDTGYDMYQGEGLGDLGGPELYGDRYSPKVPSTSRGLMIGAAVGLAATALLGSLAFLVSKSEKKHSAQRRTRHAGAAKSARAHSGKSHASTRSGAGASESSRKPSKARRSASSTASAKSRGGLKSASSKRSKSGSSSQARA